MKTPFSDYCLLTIRLMELDETTEVGAAAGDELRDKLDLVWEALSEEQRYSARVFVHELREEREKWPQPKKLSDEELATLETADLKAVIDVLPLLLAELRELRACKARDAEEKERRADAAKDFDEPGREHTVGDALGLRRVP